MYYGRECAEHMTERSEETEAYQAQQRALEEARKAKIDMAASARLRKRKSRQKLTDDQKSEARKKAKAGMQTYRSKLSNVETAEEKKKAAIRMR